MRRALLATVAAVLSFVGTVVILVLTRKEDALHG